MTDSRAEALKIVQNEPDVLTWVDEVSGYHCLILRVAESMHLCGYVDLPPEHGLHGMVWEYEGPLDSVSVHGGISYTRSNGCYWRFGFDCNHSGDMAPGSSYCVPGYEYRDIEYVKAETTSLARQLKELEGWKSVEDRLAEAERKATEYRNELIGVLTQIKTSEIGGRYAGIGQRIDELVKEGL